MTVDARKGSDVGCEDYVFTKAWSPPPRLVVLKQVAAGFLLALVDSRRGPVLGACNSRRSMLNLGLLPGSLGAKTSARSFHPRFQLNIPYRVAGATCGQAAAAVSVRLPTRRQPLPK